MEFFKTPIGAKEILTESELVHIQTSPDIVGDEDRDCEFFRHLEKKQDIYLDESQLNVVRATNGPLLVLAGAGSGKTRTLITRVKYLLEVEKVPPNQILLMTFSQDATQEMRQRLSEILDEVDFEPLLIGTIHSIFLRFLRVRGFKERIITEQIPYLLKRILKEEKLDAMFSVEEIKAKISYWKNHSLSPNHVKTENGVEDMMCLVYEKYEEYKHSKSLWDFDDILLMAKNHLMEEEEYRLYLQQFFRYICIDETQDLNNIQFEILKLISTPQSNILFIGDKRQSIYGFRNSSSKYMESLSCYYPNIQTLHLLTNYRSNTQIVGLSDYVLMQEEKACVAQRQTNEQALHFGRPKNSHEEARWISEIIDAEVKKGKKYSDIAILYRTNAYGRAVIEEMLLKGIPSQLRASENIYDKRIAKQLLAYLKLAVNPYDVPALQDIATTLYISKDAAYEQTLLVEEGVYGGIELFRPLIKDFQLVDFEKRKQLIEKISSFEPQTAIRLIRENFYSRFISSVTENSLQQTATNEILDEIEESASRFSYIEDFLAFIETIHNLLSGEVEENAVQIMTIHRSKGLEFDTVFVIGASEGIIPHSSAEIKAPDCALSLEEALYEENRIFYVSVSRAKNKLYILSPKVHHNKLRKVTRFLTKEI